MRRLLWALMAIAAAALIAQSTAAFEPGRNEPRVAEITALVRQLGHAEYAQRQAATRALEAVGSPALNALRAAAASDGDAEIRIRAKAIVRAITLRVRADEARDELAKYEGDWSNDEQKLAIHGRRWTSSTPTNGSITGSLKAIELREKVALVDLVVEDGPTKGATCKIIFRLDGDTLHYCGTYDAARPTDFQSAGSHVYVAWKRSRPMGPPGAGK